MLVLIRRTSLLLPLLSLGEPDVELYLQLIMKSEKQRSTKSGGSFCTGAWIVLVEQMIIVGSDGW